MSKRDEQWLDSMSDDFPYHLVGPLSLKGEAGDAFGSCISRPVPAGMRTWAFETAEARDAFALAYKLGVAQ